MIAVAVIVFSPSRGCELPERLPEFNERRRHMSSEMRGCSVSEGCRLLAFGATRAVVVGVPVAACDADAVAGFLAQRRAREGAAPERVFGLRRNR